MLLNTVGVNDMRHNQVETAIHLRKSGMTPREMLISLLEDEGDSAGWDEGDLVQDAAMRLDQSPEECLRMVNIALSGLLRDGLVIRDGQLICLRE